MDLNTRLSEAGRRDVDVVLTADGKDVKFRHAAEQEKWVDEYLRPHKADIIRHLSGGPAPAADVETAGGEQQKDTVAERYKPFPVGVLPEPMRSLVEAGADAVGCDPSYFALPALTVCAAAIGNSRKIELKRGWYEPSILWTCFVGESGTKKSPPLESVLEPVRRREADAHHRHAAEMSRYEVDAEKYKRQMSRWDDELGGEPPEKPIEPILERHLVDDITTESLAVILSRQPRGILVGKDELAGWITSFDRYTAGGRGGDAARWLEMFGGRPLQVDRKGGHAGKGTIYVPRASVSVTGGIQPGTMARCIGIDRREDGMLARILLAWPARRVIGWRETEISDDVIGRWCDVVDRLYDLEPSTDDYGAPQPALIPLSPEGKAAFVDFCNSHAEEQAALTGDLAAAWSKLEGYAARLALVVHCVRAAAGDRTLRDCGRIDETSITAGITLARWFGREARRVYAVFGESDDAKDRRQLAELVERLGGAATPRDLMRSSRAYPTAAHAESALTGLVKDGIGQWTDDDHGGGRGRPVRRFFLADIDGGLGADADTNRVLPGKTAYVSTVSASNGIAPAESGGPDEVCRWVG
jgi:hypothetical protein